MRNVLLGHEQVVPESTSKVLIFVYELVVLTILQKFVSKTRMRKVLKGHPDRGCKRVKYEQRTRSLLPRSWK